MMKCFEDVGTGQVPAQGQIKQARILPDLRPFSQTTRLHSMNALQMGVPRLRPPTRVRSPEPQVSRLPAQHGSAVHEVLYSYSLSTSLMKHEIGAMFCNIPISLKGQMNCEIRPIYHVLLCPEKVYGPQTLLKCR